MNGKILTSNGRDLLSFVKLGWKVGATLIVAFLVFGSVVFLRSTNAAAWSSTNSAHTPVTICHATGSDKNPYVKITVDDNSVDVGVGHNRDGHQDGRDIIPPGAWDADGRNWNSEGRAILDNDCKVPEKSPAPIPSNHHESCDSDNDNGTDESDDVCPTPTPTPSPSPTPSPTPVPTVSPTPTPVVTTVNNNTNTNNNDNNNEQHQDQTQNNNQTVNVTVNQTMTTTTGQVEGTKSANITKSPETGVSVLSMTTMFGMLPFGLFLARFGKRRKLAVEQINLATLGNALVRIRTKGAKKA